MAEVANPIEEIGAVVLTLAASGIGFKRAAGGIVDPFMTWNPATGDVTLTPPVGTDAGGGTRTIRLTSAMSLVSSLVVAGGSVGAYAYAIAQNDGGNTLLGVEGSIAGTLTPGSTVYSSLIGTNQPRALHLFTNNAIRLTIDAAGSTTIKQANGGTGHFIIDNSATVGGRKWHIGYSGLGTGNVSKLSVYDETDNVTALTIDGSGSMALAGGISSASGVINTSATGNAMGITTTAFAVAYINVTVDSASVPKTVIFGSDITAGGAGFVGTLTNHPFQIRSNNVTAITIAVSGIVTFVSSIVATTVIASGVVTLGSATGASFDISWNGTTGGALQTYASKPLSLNPGGNAVAVGASGVPSPLVVWGMATLNAGLSLAGSALITATGIAGPAYSEFRNAGANLLFGIEGVGGGGVVAGTAPWATVIGNNYGAGPLQFVTAGVVRMTIANTGGISMPGIGGGAISASGVDTAGAGFRALRVPN